MEKLFAVLDQGSSGSRAFIVNARGEIIVKKHKEITSKHLGTNLAEYDGQELLESQLNVFQSALTEVDLKNISAVALSSQRSTIVLWDKSTGVPVAPVLTWQDGRGYQFSESVQITQPEMHAITGLYKTPFYSAAKIAWCFANVPAVKETLAKNNLLIAPVASFIIWHLTKGKVFATDATLAQRTLLFNINTFDWDDKLLSAFGVPRECLPEIKNTVDNYGDYNGIPITVCVGDQQAASAGIGIAAPGDTAINYGTGAFSLTSTGSELKTIPGILTSVGVTTAQRQRHYLLEGPVNAAGAVFQWLNGAGINFDLKDIDELYARAQNPVLFLPAFGGIGAPYWDFNTPTVMSGFTTATKKEDIAAGAVRSLCFMIADIIFYIKANGVNITTVKVSGGFAKNLSLLQFQSDILQTVILQPCEAETTALGAVSLAVEAAGADTKLWEMHNSEREFKPRLTPADAEKIYKDWRKFFDWCRTYK